MNPASVSVAPSSIRDLVAAGAAEGTYASYKYAREKTVAMRAPDEPGAYELRYLGKDSPFPTLARIPVTVTPVTATLSIPATVDAGAQIAVTWTGPDDATSAEALAQSLSTALRTPFEVLDAKGTVVAQGLVGGEPLTLPGGESRVRTRTRAAFETQAVVVGGEETRVAVSP